MKSAYLDCFSGVSGDMVLGALLDAGLPLDSLTAELAKLPLAGYRISAQRASRGIITGTQVKVAKEKSDEERRLEDILSLIERGTLSQKVKKRSALIFRKGEVVRKVKEGEMVQVLLAEIRALLE